MKHKRLLPIALTVCMVVMLALTALTQAWAAPVITDLWIGDSSAITALGTVSGTGATAGTAVVSLDDSYNPVITLTDFVYSGAGHNGAAICYGGTRPLTIVLVGDSSVTQTASEAPAYSYGIYAADVLTITGEGTLTAAGGPATSGSYGVSASGITIENSGTTGSYVTADAGNVTGKDGISCGVYAVNDLTVSDSTLNAAGGTTSGLYSVSYGVFAENGDVELTDGSTMIVAGGTADDKSCGLYGYADVTVTDSTLEATGDTASGEDGVSYGVCVSAGFAISDGSTVTATSGTAAMYSYGVKVGALTVEGSSLTATADAPTEGISCGIYVEGATVLTDAAVCCCGGEASSDISYGFYGENDVTVTGSELEAIGLTGESSYGICVYGDFVIEKGGSGVGSAVSASGGEATAQSGCSYGVYASGSLTVTDSELTATADAANDTSYGVYTDGGLTVTGSTLTAESDEAGSSYGLYIYGDVDIVKSDSGDGSVVTAKGGKATAEYGDSYGAYIYGMLTVTDSELTAEGGTANDESGAVFICGSDIFPKNLTVTDGRLLATGGDGHYSYGIFVNSGSITIGKSENGYGSYVCATSNDAEYESYAVYAYQDLTVADSTLEATAKAGDNNCSVGIYAQKGSIALTNAEVTAAGDVSDNFGSYGVRAEEGSLTVTDSDLFATSGNGEASYGIYADDVTIGKSENGDGSYVCAKAGETTDGDSYGVYTNEGLTVTDSELYACGGEAADDSYGVYASSNDIALTGAKVTATASAAGSYSIGMRSYEGDITVTDTELVSVGRTADDYSAGVEAYKGSVTLDGSTVIAFGSAADDGDGIRADDKNVTVTDSDLDAMGIYSAIYAKLINNVTGTGWDDAGEAENTETIGTSESGRKLYYQRIRLGDPIPLPEKFDLIIGLNTVSLRYDASDATPDTETEYWFTPAKNGEHTFTLASDYGCSLSLFAPGSGDELGAADTNDTASFTCDLTAGTKYLVRVTAQSTQADGETADVTIEKQASAALPDSSYLSPGENVVETAYNNWFHFYAPVTGAYTISCSDTSGLTGKLTVYIPTNSPDEQYMTLSEDTSGSDDLTLSCNLLRGYQYVLMFTSSLETEATLNVERTGPATDPVPTNPYPFTLALTAEAQADSALLSLTEEGSSAEIEFDSNGTATIYTDKIYVMKLLSGTQVDQRICFGSTGTDTEYDTAIKTTDANGNDVYTFSLGGNVVDPGVTVVTIGGDGGVFRVTEAVWNAGGFLWLREASWRESITIDASTVDLDETTRTVRLPVDGEYVVLVTKGTTVAFSEGFGYIQQLDPARDVPAGAIPSGYTAAGVDAWYFEYAPGPTADPGAVTVGGVPNTYLLPGNNAVTAGSGETGLFFYAPLSGEYTFTLSGATGLSAALTDRAGDPVEPVSGKPASYLLTPGTRYTLCLTNSGDAVGATVNVARTGPGASVSSSKYYTLVLTETARQNVLLSLTEEGSSAQITPVSGQATLYAGKTYVMKVAADTPISGSLWYDSEGEYTRGNNAIKTSDDSGNDVYTFCLGENAVDASGRTAVIVGDILYTLQVAEDDADAFCGLYVINYDDVALTQSLGASVTLETDGTATLSSANWYALVVETGTKVNYSSSFGAVVAVSDRDKTELLTGHYNLDEVDLHIFRYSPYGSPQYWTPGLVSVGGVSAGGTFPFAVTELGEDSFVSLETYSGDVTLTDWTATLSVHTLYRLAVNEGTPVPTLDYLYMLFGSSSQNEDYLIISKSTSNGETEYVFAVSSEFIEDYEDEEGIDFAITVGLDEGDVFPFTVTELGEDGFVSLGMSNGSAVALKNGTAYLTIGTLYQLVVDEGTPVYPLDMLNAKFSQNSPAPGEVVLVKTTSNGKTTYTFGFMSDFIEDYEDEEETDFAIVVGKYTVVFLDEDEDEIGSLGVNPGVTIAAAYPYGFDFINDLYNRTDPPEDGQYFIGWEDADTGELLGDIEVIAVTLPITKDMVLLPAYRLPVAAVSIGDSGPEYFFSLADAMLAVEEAYAEDYAADPTNVSHYIPDIVILNDYEAPSEICTGAGMKAVVLEESVLPEGISFQQQPAALAPAPAAVPVSASGLPFTVPMYIFLNGHDVTVGVIRTMADLVVYDDSDDPGTLTSDIECGTASVSTLVVEEATLDCGHFEWYYSPSYGSGSELSGPTNPSLSYFSLPPVVIMDDVVFNGFNCLALGWEDNEIVACLDVEDNSGIFLGGAAILSTDSELAEEIVDAISGYLKPGQTTTVSTVSRDFYGKTGTFYAVSFVENGAAVTKDVLLCNWTTLKYDGNGATSGSMSDQFVPLGTETTLSANAFTRTGYVFKGWNTVATPTEQNPGTAYADGESVTPEGDMTLYAQWENSITISSITADKTSAVAGESITWTAEATGGSGTLQYCFYLYKGSTAVYKGAYGTAKTFTYTPTEAGSYTAKVFVKDGAGASASKTSAAVTVTAATPITISSVTADKTTANVGDSITWTTTATGGTGTLQYSFDVYKDGAVISRGSYGTANTYTYKATEAGSYTVEAFVKDGTGTAVSKTSTAVTVTKAVTPITISSITADKTSAVAGESITWTAEATGGSGTLKYCFYVYKDGQTVQKGSYGTAKTYTYTATEAGSYSVKVFVKDGVGTAASKMSAAVTVTATAPITISSITANKNTANVGDTITWTASATGGTGTLKYCFYVYNGSTTVYKGSYGTGKTVSYTATAAGTYSVKVFVKDGAGASTTLVGGEVTVTAPGPVELTVTSLKANKTTANVGDTITWTASASGGSGTLKYCFYVYKDGQTVQKGAYGTAKTYTYTPTAAGTYTVKVFVKDGTGTATTLVGGTVTVAS